MCFGLCPDGKRGVEHNTVLIALTVLIILIVVRSDGKRSNSVCVCVYRRSYLIWSPATVPPCSSSRVLVVVAVVVVVAAVAVAVVVFNFYDGPEPRLSPQVYTTILRIVEL